MLELGGAGGTAQADGANVIEGSDETFMTEVIDGSQNGAVVVQFTADWCGPCKTLGPRLEASVAKQNGKVKLVRIDIDKNQQVAGQMRVQSIPAVFAFVGGQPVDGFMGAQMTQSQIDEFVTKVANEAGSSPEEMQLDQVLDAAEEAVAQGAVGEAAQAYAQVLGIAPENLRAITGLARCYAANQDFDRAKETLAMVPEDRAEDPLVKQVESMMALAEAAGGSGDAAQLISKVEANPNDHQARYDLSLALVGAGQPDAAIDHLLELIRKDAEWNEGAAKEQLFKVFDALGPADPLTLSGRRKLSSILFA